MTTLQAAATEITGKRDYEGRDDLGVLECRLLGHKFQKAPGEEHDDAPAGYKKTKIFDLERHIAVKRRSHYA